MSPVYKKNDNLNKANYRPVSILPSVSKIYESLMADQLTRQIILKTSLINCCQDLEGRDGRGRGEGGRGEGEGDGVGEGGCEGMEGKRGREGGREGPERSSGSLQPSLPLRSGPSLRLRSGPSLSPSLPPEARVPSSPPSLPLILFKTL